MEKPEATYSEFTTTARSESTMNDKEATVQSITRKALPQPPSTYKQPEPFQKEIGLNQKEVGLDQIQHSNSLPIYNQSQSHGPRRRQTFFSKIRFRWQKLSWRARCAVVAGITCLLVLIIGLSAGLGRRSRITNLPLPSNHGGPYQGDLTYYDPGLGACGIVSSSSDAICAVSHLIFDAVSTGSNPNANPLCGKKIRARRDGKSIDLTVVDRCTGCKATDIDTTMSVFGQLAQIDQGRVLLDWSWLEDVPGAAATA